MMMPKVEGPWDIHYLDQLLGQLRRTQHQEAYHDPCFAETAEA